MTDTPRAIIWDMDGVIGDKAEFHFRSWQCGFKKQGKVFTLEDFRHFIGQRNDIIVGLRFEGC